MYSKTHNELIKITGRTKTKLLRVATLICRSIQSSTFSVTSASVSGTRRRWVDFIVSVCYCTDHLPSTQESCHRWRTGRIWSWAGSLAGRTRCKVPCPDVTCWSPHRLPGSTYSSVARGWSDSVGVDRWRHWSGRSSDVAAWSCCDVPRWCWKRLPLGRHSSQWTDCKSNTCRLVPRYKTKSQLLSSSYCTVII